MIELFLMKYPGKMTRKAGLGRPVGPDLPDGQNGRWSGPTSRFLKKNFAGGGTMQKEDRAFRRLLTEAIVSGPEKVTRDEIHAALGIGKNMISAARSTAKKTAETEAVDRVAGRPTKSRKVTTALQRLRKTTKFCEKRKLVKQFFLENSTPTSRNRDVMKIKVECLYWER